MEASSPQPSLSPARAAWREPSALLAVLLLLFTALRAWEYPRNFPGVDFYQFWVVGQIVKESPRTDVYSAAEREAIARAFLETSRDDPESRLHVAAKNRTVLETYSTPFLYSLFRIFSTGDYNRDYMCFSLVGLVASVAGAVAVARLLGFSWVASFVAAALLLEIEPRRSDARVANVNQIQFALLAAFLWMQARRRTRLSDLGGGIVLGALILFKPNVGVVPLSVGLFWLARGERAKLVRVVAGMATGALAAAVVSAVVFRGWWPWMSWWAAIRTMPDSIIAVQLGNVSPSLVAKEVTGVALGPLLAVAAIAGCLVRVWKARCVDHSEREFLVETVRWAGLGCALYLLSARLVWVHYHVLAVPLLLVALRPRPMGAPAGWILLTALAIAAVARSPVVNLLGLHDPVAIAAVSAVGILLLFIVGVGDPMSLLAGPPRSAAAPSGSDALPRTDSPPAA